MATSSLIPTQHAAASISLATAHSAASSAAGSSQSGSSDGGATISANDFLTLLVTEMQHQDPTAQTDPNEYINQLVQVNSLQQLIQINQTLSSAVPPPSTGASGLSAAVAEGSRPNAHAPASPAAASAHAPATPPSAQAAALTPTPAPVAAPVNSGNLSVPSTSAAALRVAGALGSRGRR